MTTDIEIIDYSKKAFAVIGNTKPIKDKLKNLGGRFNFRLKCGAGWIFAKTNLNKIETELKINMCSDTILKTSINKVHWLYDLTEKGERASKYVSKYIREQAKILNIKCSVKTDHSIRVEIKEFADNIKELYDLCSMLQGYGFDGTIDYQYNYRHGINKEGKIICLGTSGTVNCGGYVEDTLLKMPKDFIEFSVYNYIFVSESFKTNNPFDEN